MKKQIFLSLIPIVAIILFSFAPSGEGTGTGTSVITCSDGTVIIPSGVNMSLADQQEMLSIMSSYGTNAGFLVYTSGSSVSVYNAPLSSSALSAAETEFGCNLSTSTPGTGWAIYKENICLSMATQVLYQESSVTIALHDELAPILSNYGYEE